MKTERRHELQTNQLADWIGHRFEHVKTHGKTIVAAAILGAAVIIAAAVILKDREAAQSAAWTEFHIGLAANDTAILADVAKQHPGTAVALWAKQAEADMDLTRGIDALFINREDAMLALSDARKRYGEVIAGAGSIPELMQKALFGMAKAQEASTNLDEAKNYYKQVADKFPDTPIAKEAAKRLTALNDSETVKWYSWFGRQKPRASTRSSLPNIPGMPDDLTTLPDSSNLPPAPEGGPLFPPQDVPEIKLPAATDVPVAPGDAKKDADPAATATEKSAPAPSATTPPVEKEPAKETDTPAPATPATPPAPASPPKTPDPAPPGAAAPK
jgi:hypothetical protein